MVEFTLVLPVLLLLLYGIFEFGRLLLIYNQVNTASREAARFGSAVGQGITANTPKYADCAGIRQTARNSGVVVAITDANINIKYDDGPGTTASSGDCTVPGTIAIGDRIMVTVSATYSPILPVPYLSTIPITSVAARSILTEIEIVGTGGSTGGGTTPVVPQVKFQYASATYNENEGTVTIPVALSTATTVPVQVNISVSGGTAVAGTNYTFSTVLLTIPANATTGQISVALIDDTFYDIPKTVIFSMGNNPSNATLGSPSTFTLSIANVNPPPNVSFQYSTSTITETTGSLAIAVLLKDALGNYKASKLPTTVYFGLGGTGVLGSNYNLNPVSSVTIAAGATSGFIILTPINNGIFDPTLTVIFTISSATNDGAGTLAGIGTPSMHTVNLKDNNIPTVAFSTASLSVNKTAGTATATITMSPASSQVVTVPFTKSGTATSPTHYTVNPASTITFNPGETSKTVVFSLVNTAIPQGNLTAILTLGTPSLNVKLGTLKTFTLTITEIYVPPTAAFSVSTAAVNEGLSTTINVVLSGYANANVTVPFTLGGTAVKTTHYSASPATSVSIPFGQLSASITFATVADPLYSGPRTIIVTMSTPTGGSVTKGSPSVSTITINDLTTKPSVYFNGVSNVVAEDAGTVSVPVKLTNAAASAVTVTFRVNTASTAVAGTDYTVFSNYVVTFPSGVLEMNISVQIRQNPTPDLNPRTLVLDLVTPVTMASIGAPNQYTLTIRDNQICPRFANIVPSGPTSKLTLYLANDRLYATEVDILSLTISSNSDPSNTVSMLSWLDSVPSVSITPGVLVGSPILINTAQHWTLATSVPPAPSTGYRLLVIFGTAPTSLSEYTVSITYSNNCIRTTTASFP